jgi:hypothetical protein
MSGAPASALPLPGRMTLQASVAPGHARMAVASASNASPASLR